MNAIRRMVLPADMELRQEGEEKKKKLVGTAMVWNRETRLWGEFYERFAPGAFKEFLATKPDVRSLFNHNPNFVLGRTASGTMRLAEDDRGLQVEIDPPDTSYARDLLVSVERKDIGGMSVNFIPKEERLIRYPKRQVREIVRADLPEVSVVTFPAYPQTKVSVRSVAVLTGLEERMIEEAEPFLEAHSGIISAEMRATLDRINASLAAEFEERATEVQTVIFDKDDWTAAEAKTWLKDHDFQSDKMDETDSTFHFRQFDPAECAKDSFMTLKRNLPDGVSMVACKRGRSASGEMERLLARQTLQEKFFPSAA